MMNSRSIRFAASSLLLAAMAQGPQAAELISPAPEFRLQTTGALVQVSLKEHVCSGMNTVDRKLMEGLCAIGRELGQTTATPVFGEGFDRPNTWRILTVTNAIASAELKTFSVYNCSEMQAQGSLEACSCHYKIIPVHFLDVRKRFGDWIEFSKTDYSAKPNGKTSRYRAGPFPDVMASLKPFPVSGPACEVVRTRDDALIDRGAFELPQGTRLIELGDIRGGGK